MNTGGRRAAIWNLSPGSISLGSSGTCSGGLWRSLPPRWRRWSGTSRRRAPVADSRWVVGIDIGGAFADASATSVDGKGLVAKVPATPGDPGLAFVQALAALADAGVLPESVLMIFHGTTAATNALLTGQTARVVLATTQGFRDILGYREGSRPAVYDLTQPRPRQLVRPRDRIEVAAPLSGLWRVVTALGPRHIERGAAAGQGASPEAVPAGP